MELLMNDADGSIAIFDFDIFYHRMTDKDKTSFIFDVDLEYPPELHDRDDDYPLALEVMTIDPE